MKHDIMIIGGQAQLCPSTSEALRTGSPCRVEAGKTIADGIRVAETGVYTFPIIQRYVDRHVLATEEEIADAMLLLLERKHIIAEGAGAVPLAALMNGSIDVPSGITIVLVISGEMLTAPCSSGLSGSRFPARDELCDFQYYLMTSLALLPIS